ncbi:hypothetical protein LSUB1_G001806 [Lachnellula subtilissima]|uniref:Uncharacterized protein n=1 Tax=Lachnellula subtilissima TaxID=602034 RepID=A0A8H8RX72_9HELO|nr:hypothetical protein LSUB1_G001806 [Lachnellula subtilissima]
MGDFIPNSVPNLKTAQPPNKGFVVMNSVNPDAQSVVMSGIAASDAKFGSVARPTNPYQFEPDTPYINVQHQTKMTDFMQKHGSSPIPLPSSRPGHAKKSYSEGNAVPITQTPEVPDTPFEKPILHVLHRYRSESSPNIPPLRFAEHPDPGSSPTFQSYQGVGDGFAFPNRRLPTAEQHNNPYIQDYGPSAVTYQTSRDYATERPARSLSRLQVQTHCKDASASVNGRYLANLPTKTLDEVFEKDEAEGTYPESPESSPPKRSRSPMKKMFGENGWLGRSPAELEDLKTRVKKASSRKDESTGSPQKKTGMMGKLKNKLEEFAEKADLSTKNPHSSHDKHPKLSILARSLSPPEQARVDMELELSLVHTANNFLMSQFRQGRMAVESIKKVSDAWRSKGRYRVIEFMYDQGTQRELVVANQHNLRFHGERAGDEIRINAMLYNWKQVSNLMAIRTFCNADTVILKLIFDIEQILELLGATEPILLRLQHIRAQASQSMRVAHRKENDKPTSQQYRGNKANDESMSTDNSTSQKYRGFQEQAKDNRSSTASALSATTRSVATDKSFDDPYGGMKLVPDHYVEDS